jgi:hypothetical protein
MTLGGVQPLPQQPQLQPGIINADGSPYVPPTDFTKIAADIPKARAITNDDTAILQALVQKNPQILPDVTTAIAERHATPTQVLDHIQQQYGQQQDQGVGGAQGFALGATKGGFGTLNTISDIGQSILSQTVGRLVNAVTGKGFGATDKALIDKQNLQAHGTAETLGKIAENTAEFFVPGGAVGKVGKVADTGIEGLNLADKLGTAGKVAAGALKLGTKAALGASEAAGITALQTGGDVPQIKNAALIGGIFPTAEALLSAAANKIAPRMVNSLIKPLSKDFEFGKNPGSAVVNEGITGTTWDSLVGNIKSVKNSIGEQIGKILSNPEVDKQTVSMTKAVTPIDEAIQKATKQGDQALINKLMEFRDGLTKQYNLVDGKLVEVGSKPTLITPSEALGVKGDIGDSIRWREGIDSEVNKVKVKVYQNVRNQMETAVNLARKADPAIADIGALNGRYANLTTAESSAMYRKTIVDRLNLSSLAQKGTALLGAGLAGKDFITGNTKDIPKDLLIGAGGALLEKGFGTVAGKTFGAQAIKNAPKIGRTVRNVVLGVNSNLTK